MDTEKMLPDHHIEQFWMDFKQSMCNFYKAFDSKFMKRDITTWSSLLNELQSKQKYGLIERQIRDYIICYGIDVMRSGSRYHLGILKSNVHRWDLLSQKYALLNSDNESPETHTRNMFQTCLEICFTLDKSKIRLDCFDDIEMIVIQENISILITMALEWNKPSILDILLKYHKEKVMSELRDMVGNENDFDDLFKGISLDALKGKTLLKLLKSKQ